MLQAIQIVHENNIIHADITPANIGILNATTLRFELLDFGNAISLPTCRLDYIQTRTYRAPEIVLGIPYSFPIDLWSLGCILVELALGKALFEAESEFILLQMIVALIGLPPLSICSSAKRYQSALSKLRFPSKVFQCFDNIKEYLVSLDEDLSDFVFCLLKWDGQLRLTSSQAVLHPWLK